MSSQYQQLEGIDEDVDQPEPEQTPPLLCSVCGINLVFACLYVCLMSVCQ